MTLITKQLHSIASLLATVCFISWMICSPSFAGEFHNPRAIEQAAIDFVNTQIPDNVTINKISATPIDPRVRFKQCSKTLETYATTNQTISKRWTVGVRCNDKVMWSIYIPITAHLTKKMIVSDTTITRGELITKDKIKLVDQEITHGRFKHFSDFDDVIGREARKTIYPQRIITSHMLQKALLVKKKETVLIYAQSKKMRISMKGTALKNGHHNEMIKVRNNSSNKIIDAVVVDRGIVAVNF